MSTQSSPQQNRNIDDVPVAILWDMESCPVPNNISTEEVAGNIRTSLQVHPQINGHVPIFSAYGDFEMFPPCIREGCQKARVKWIQVPKGGNGSVLLTDMFLFAVDNRPPANIMLISGDEKVFQALHPLCERGFTAILAIPSGVAVSSALRDGGCIVCDWPSLLKTSRCYLNGLERELVEDTSDKIEIKVEGPMKTVQQRRAFYKKIQKILGSIVGGVPMSCLHWLEQKYERVCKKPLDYESLGVKNIGELVDEMCKKRMALVSEEPESKLTYVMSVPMVNSRQQLVLKRNVQEILDMCSGEIPLSSFEEKYKDRFMVNLKYHIYGLTGFDHLCKVLNLVVEQGNSGENVIKAGISLRRRKRNE